MKASKQISNVWMIAGVFFLLGIWYIISYFAGSEQLMPTPSKTIVSLFLLYKDPAFLKAVTFTILRGLGGAGVTLIAGSLVALLASRSERTRHFLTPTIVVLRSTPVISFILLAIVWMTPNQVPVFIAMLTMFPIMYSNVVEGILQIDPNLIRMSRVFGVSRRARLQHLYWPSIQPFFYSGLSTALGFGWRAIIVGEVLAHPDFGIGTSLKTAQSYLEVDKIIAWTILGILVSAIFDKGITIIRNRNLKWQSA